MTLLYHSNIDTKDLILSEFQLGSKTNHADSLAFSTPNQITIPSPQAPITPLSHESLVSQHHSRSASVPTVPHTMHPAHFSHIESHTQPVVASNRMQQRPDLSHSTHSTNKILVENQSMHLTNNYHSPMEHFDQQSYGNHYSSTGVIHSTLNSQLNTEHNDVNYDNGFYDDNINHETLQHLYQMNCYEENEYEIHLPSDFYSKCMANYGIEENYNVLCNG